MSPPYRDSANEDSALLVGAFVFAFIVTVWLLWTGFHTDVAYWSLRANWVLLGALDWQWGPSWPSSVRLDMASAASRASQLEPGELITLLNRAGYFFVPGMILFGACVARSMWKHPSNRIHRPITFKSLPWIMAKIAPAGIPALYYGNLLEEDPDEHKSALDPVEWAAKHGLVVNMRLDRSRALKVLSEDLGQRAASPHDLAPHEKALYAIFAARLFGSGSDYSSTQSLLDALNVSCHTGTHDGKRGYPNLAVAEEQFNRFADAPGAAEFFRIHGFRRTALYAMHGEAIKRGRIPTSNFRWLKGIDRGLWYALETTGRKVPFIESAAVFTQARWETYVSHFGQILTNPHLDDALTAIEVYLAKVGIVQPLPKKRTT